MGCMDLVSIETPDEYEWLKQRIQNVKYIWTSGRLCNFDGCDRPDFFPKSINGWFWSANQARLNPTNGTRFQDWSFTGGFNPPRRQPDNREKEQQGGEDEACLAVLNNFYGDGIKWHDVACHHEKPIVCEDTEGHLNLVGKLSLTSGYLKCIISVKNSHPNQDFFTISNMGYYLFLFICQIGFLKRLFF